MSIPLVQNNEKDSINTSIIAIKKDLERINSILGLVDSGSDIDTSEFVKKSDIVDVVQSGNMNPVTSNAVATSNAMPVDEVTLGNMHSITSNAVSGFRTEVLRRFNKYGDNVSYISQESLLGFNSYFANLARYVPFDYNSTSGVEYRIIGYKHTNYGTGIAFTRGNILGIYISNNAVTKQRVLFNLNT